GFRQQLSRFVQNWQPNSHGATRIDRKDLTLAKHEDRELAVDLPADVELRGRNLFIDDRAFQRIEPRSSSAAIILGPTQQQRISQGSGRSNAIIGELDFHTTAIEQGRTHWAASSAACSSGAFSSRLERCRISRYVSPLVRPSRKPRNELAPRRS